MDTLTLAFPFSISPDTLISELQTSEVIMNADTENKTILLASVPIHFEYSVQAANDAIPELFSDCENEESLGALKEHQVILFLQYKVGTPQQQMPLIVKAIKKLFEGGALGIYVENSGKATLKEDWTETEYPVENFIQVVKNKQLLGSVGMQAWGCPDLCLPFNRASKEIDHELICTACEDRIRNPKEVKLGAFISDEEQSQSYSISKSAKPLFPKVHSLFNPKGYWLLTKQAK